MGVTSQRSKVIPLAMMCRSETPSNVPAAELSGSAAAAPGCLRRAPPRILHNLLQPESRQRAQVRWAAAVLRASAAFAAYLRCERVACRFARLTSHIALRTWGGQRSQIRRPASRSQAVPASLGLATEADGAAGTDLLRFVADVVDGGAGRVVQTMLSPRFPSETAPSRITWTVSAPARLPVDACRAPLLSVRARPASSIGRRWCWAG
jgi:hypothetical protein